MMKVKIIFIMATLFSCTIAGQKITYSHISTTSEKLKEYLLTSGEYFTGGNSYLPYFHGKKDNKYIKFYETIGVIVTFDFKTKSEYLSLIKEIQNRANLKFKFCAAFDENIVYNYETSGGNMIRFNFSEMRISVQFPSDLNDFLESNSEFSTVFVCVSSDAYAYHTNLRCPGLANCEANIAKTEIKEAKNFRYRICEICTDDRQEKELVTEALSITTPSKSINYPQKSSIKISDRFINEAEHMFENYLPTILKSKGENASIYNRYTYTGDFSKDGFDDVIIWFVYGNGGTAIGGVEAAFYENREGKPKVVAGFEPDYSFSIDKIENGIVYCTKTLYDKEDPQCCPSIHIPIELSYSNFKIYVKEN